MPRSEKAAWRRVLEIASKMRDNGSGARDELMELAADMLDQVAEGIHTNPARRANPPLVIWANSGKTVPVQLDQMLSRRAYSLAYQHEDDGVDYEHPFDAGVRVDTVLIGDRATSRQQTRGILLYRPDGKPAWDDIEVDA